jgi:heat shock protein beta
VPHSLIRDSFSLGVSEVFLRELISNANDALEKFRLTALTHQGMWDGSPLNVTIKAVNGSDGSGRIIITGILLYPIELFS